MFEESLSLQFLLPLQPHLRFQHFLGLRHRRHHHREYRTGLKENHCPLLHPHHHF
jgi:hypothetical protein